MSNLFNNIKIVATIGISVLIMGFYIVDIYWINFFFNADSSLMFFLLIFVSNILMISVFWAESGNKVFIRDIPGIKAMEEAVGRATEMGKPVLFVPGILDLNEVETIAGINILGHVAKITAEYETSLNVPVSKSIVMEAAREICKESYLQIGRPDLYHNDMVHYLAEDQFAYAAGINGIMVREKPAACLYQGKFYAESLLLAETGNRIGAIQIAGTGSSSQIPFFVTACDYTLIGEEFLTASAILSDRKDLLGSVRGQDIIKLFIITAMLVIVLFNVTFWWIYT
ncbi:MAG: hypothetical protein CMG00_05275 [Candidatus Marinimicrobia bacterium]|nr:hypothetical protein [Candidatus Neomarinimicrobiota bacterium]|tara:strand:- start:2595 stop:3446 length:852 start_codon:yes stop_codon:yes gene_type:complete